MNYYNDEHFAGLLTDLESEMSSGDKPGILHVYDEFSNFNFENIPLHLLDEYDRLIDESNRNILYESDGLYLHIN